MIRNLPKHVTNGLILAKAVRIASIAQPENIESFELQEPIKTDDVISSFILKACLFSYDKQKKEFDKCLTPHDVATKIYELLQTYLNERLVKSEYSHEEPVHCTYCAVERGCCKRRNLMLAMVEKILQWLNEYKARLQKIDFAEDFNFCDAFKIDFTDPLLIPVHKFLYCNFMIIDEAELDKVDDILRDEDELDWS